MTSFPAKESVLRMEAPICLIDSEEIQGRTNLIVTTEAKNILSRISQPVVVVAIVGPYRTGKSYLMNKLAGVQKGFMLGSTVQAETKGIWMWCVPHPNNKNQTLVLLDTEGLGDVEKGDSTNDIRIFSMAVLLSSALVYNSKGTIDQDALNKLKFVGEITELIKVKSENNEDEEAELSQHFPMFIWAVRDFNLELKINNKQVTEDEYLENALIPRRTVRTTRDREYNTLRERLRMYFGTRKCFVFPFPATNENTLQRLDEIAETDLKPSFVSKTQTFCDYIFQNVKEKIVQHSLTVTGQRLGELARIYTESINSSNSVVMDDAVFSLSEKENKMAVQEAVQYFEERMKQVALPTETSADFSNLCRQYESEARNIFVKRSFRDENNKFLEEFVEILYKKEAEFSTMNEEKSRQICNSLIQRYYVEFETALANGAYFSPGGHERFKQDLEVVQQRYKAESGKGLKAEEVLQEYIKSKQSIGAAILQGDITLTQMEKEREEENARRRQKEMEDKLRQEETDKNIKRLQDMNSFSQETIKQLQNKLEEEKRLMSEKLEQVIEEKERESRRYQEERLHEQANMFEEQIRDLKMQKQEEMQNVKEREQQGKIDITLPTLTEVTGLLTAIFDRVIPPFSNQPPASTLPSPMPNLAPLSVPFLTPAPIPCFPPMQICPPFPCPPCPPPPPGGCWQ